MLPAALLDGAAVRLAAGEIAAAASMTQEAEAIARATGNPIGPYGPLLLAAWRGRDAEDASADRGRHAGDGRRAAKDSG